MSLHPMHAAHVGTKNPRFVKPQLPNLALVEAAFQLASGLPTHTPLGWSFSVPIDRNLDRRWYRLLRFPPFYRMASVFYAVKQAGKIGTCINKARTLTESAPRRSDSPCTILRRSSLPSKIFGQETCQTRWRTRLQRTDLAMNETCGAIYQ